MSSSLQPPPYSNQTRLINSLAVLEYVNVTSLLNFAKNNTILCQSQNNQATSCYTCNSASLITLQNVLRLPLERGYCWVNRQAVCAHLTIPVVLYQHCSRNTSSITRFLKGCFLLKIIVYCLTEFKLQAMRNSLYPSAFFCASQISSASPDGQTVCFFTEMLLSGK
jgi:hypothetical protein